MQKGNNRAFNRYLKNRLKTQTTVGPLLNGDGVLVQDNSDMANILNTFFASVFTRENIGQIPAATAKETTDKLRQISVTEDVLRQKILKANPSKAAGPDGVHMSILQSLHGFICKPLAAIFNKSLETGVVPRDWRDAHVTPIFKKGVKSDPGNYRPVSLTSICCKLMESCIKDAIVEHVEKNNLLRNTQHGFSKGRSCTTNLLDFMEKVTDYVDKGFPVDIIYLDFAKAFDKVPHLRLAEKLKAIGIEGHILEWIKSWLSDRRQKVRVYGSESQWEQVLSGVPQGSVLGPILFIIYNDDIDCAAISPVFINKFADDTKTARPIKTEQDRIELQACLDGMCSWAMMWGMEFNVKKCKVMHIGHINNRLTYSMNGLALTESEQETDEGVLIVRATYNISHSNYLIICNK